MKAATLKTRLSQLLEENSVLSNYVDYTMMDQCTILLRLYHGLFSQLYGLYFRLYGLYIFRLYGLYFIVFELINTII